MAPPRLHPDLHALTEALSGIAPTWRGRTDERTGTQATGFTELNALLPGGGWPMGALTEIIARQEGIGEVSLTLPAIRQLCRSQRRIIFIDPPFSPDPPALHGRGLPLDLTVWIATRSDQERLWAACQLLREKATAAVLLWSAHSDERSLRKLQLAAETGRGLCFLFRGMTALHNPSPAAVRLELSPANRQLQISVRKVRGGRPGTVMIRIPKVRM